MMLYLRFDLSLRNVEDLLHERGIEIATRQYAADDIRTIRWPAQRSGDGVQIRASALAEWRSLLCA